jgi:hypothetical protein
VSQYYELGGRTLWNPATAVSRLFLGQVAAFEAELGRRSGIGPMRDDECQVEPAALAAFTRALLARHHRGAHPVALALSEGFTAAVLVLADRAGADPGEPPGSLRAAADAMSRAMPR